MPSPDRPLIAESLFRIGSRSKSSAGSIMGIGTPALCGLATPFVAGPPSRSVPAIIQKLVRARTVRVCGGSRYTAGIPSGSKSYPMPESPAQKVARCDPKPGSMFLSMVADAKQEGILVVSIDLCPDASSSAISPPEADQ